MIISDVIGFLLFILIILLLTELFFTSNFWLYLFQLKEYRFDRIICHLKISSGKKQILNNFILQNWKNRQIPSITFRFLLIVIINFIIYYYGLFIILTTIFPYLKNLNDALSLALALSLYLLIVLTPLLNYMAVFISEIILIPFKEIIYYLAYKKIVNLKNLLVIGISGSYGKTLTKDVLYEFIHKDYKVLKTPKNCNTKLGIAILILRQLSKDHQIFICEVGAYKKGEIQEVCRIIKPKIGIITGINEQHLELFGSLKNIKLAKYELIKALPKNGLAVFNNDSNTKSLIAKTKIKKIIYPDNKVNIPLKLTAEIPIMNIQLGFLTAVSLGLSHKKLIKYLRQMRPLLLKKKFKKTKTGAILIDDSYNSNPTGFIYALEQLKKMKAKQKILITPGIIELGKVSSAIHKKIGYLASEICDMVIFTKNDFIKPFKEGFLKENQNKLFKVLTKPKELTQELAKYMTKGNIILLEGRVFENIKKLR